MGQLIFIKSRKSKYSRQQTGCALPFLFFIYLFFFILRLPFHSLPSSFPLFIFFSFSPLFLLFLSFSHFCRQTENFLTATYYRGEVGWTPPHSRSLRPWWRDLKIIYDRFGENLGQHALKWLHVQKFSIAYRMSVFSTWGWGGGAPSHSSKLLSNMKTASIEYVRPTPPSPIIKLI